MIFNDLTTTTTIVVFVPFCEFVEYPPLGTSLLNAPVKVGGTTHPRWVSGGFRSQLLREVYVKVFRFRSVFSVSSRRSVARDVSVTSFLRGFKTLHFGLFQALWLPVLL